MLVELKGEQLDGTFITISLWRMFILLNSIPLASRMPLLYWFCAIWSLRKYVIMSPLPFTLICPRHLNSKWDPCRLSITSCVHCTSPGMQVESMRLATYRQKTKNTNVHHIKQNININKRFTLTVLPQISYWGFRAPMTPATTGPILMPEIKWEPVINIAPYKWNIHLIH